MIQYHLEDLPVFEFNKEKQKKKILYIIDYEGFITGSLNIIFCSDAFLLELNIKHLNHDFFTDIITFSFNSGKEVSGDLFISIDRVKDNAKVLSAEFDEELERVIYHGVLHLCGYNDKTDEDKVVMRLKEDFYLKSHVSRET